MHYRIGYSSKKENASVYIEYSLRKPGVNHPIRQIVRRLGKKQELLKKNPKVIEELQKEVDRMNETTKKNRTFTPIVTVEEYLSESEEKLRKSLGYKKARFESRCAGLLLLSPLYERLNLSYKFDYISGKYGFKYDLAKITKDLVLLRMLSPASKLRTSIKGPRDYLGFTSTNVNHMYKALDVLCANKADIINYLNKQLSKRIADRDTTACLYDITTYAFESTDQDALRDFGYSKDKKFNEVQVVMGLATDSRGIPLDYALYKGNQAETTTMVPFVSELKKKFNISKVTVVADKGLNSKGNIDSLVKLGCDYVLSSKVRGASENIKRQVLDPNGRQPITKVNEEGEIIDQGWFKELAVEDEIIYEPVNYVWEEHDERKLDELQKELNHKMTKSGKKIVSTLKRRYIITWSASRAAKDQHDRQRLINKARKLLAKPSEIKSSFKRGGRSFIQIDVQTDSARLDEQLIEEQAKFDGIHVVETSLNIAATDVVSLYANLWKIENSFRTLKSQLQARPVFVRLPDHVRGHFLICYLALCLHRFLEYMLDKADKHTSADTIIDTLNSTCISLIEPAEGVEFYGTKGFGQTAKEIMKIVGLKVLNTFESAGAMREKLKLYGAMRDFYNTAVQKI